MICSSSRQQNYVWFITKHCEYVVILKSNRIIRYSKQTPYPTQTQTKIIQIFYINVNLNLYCCPSNYSSFNLRLFKTTNCNHVWALLRCCIVHTGWTERYLQVTGALTCMLFAYFMFIISDKTFPNSSRFQRTLLEHEWEANLKK